MFHVEPCRYSMTLALASHPEVDGWDVDVIAEESHLENQHLLRVGWTSWKWSLKNESIQEPYRTLFSVFGTLCLLYLLIWEYLRHGAGSSYVLQVLLCCSLGTITCQKGLALSDLELFFKGLFRILFFDESKLLNAFCARNMWRKLVRTMIQSIWFHKWRQQNWQQISYCYTFKLGCPLLSHI